MLPKIFLQKQKETKTNIIEYSLIKIQNHKSQDNPISTIQLHIQKTQSQSQIKIFNTPLQNLNLLLTWRSLGGHST